MQACYGICFNISNAKVGLGGSWSPCNYGEIAFNPSVIPSKTYNYTSNLSDSWQYFSFHLISETSSKTKKKYCKVHKVHAIVGYMQKMGQNHNFFISLQLDEEGHLTNVFRMDV